MDFYSFYTGNEFEAYQFLGAHIEGGETVFRTFAPNAASIAVIGDFSGWQETPMSKIYDGNFWECNVKDAAPGMRYKYRITGQDRKTLDHCDPYGFSAEKRPNTASVICDLHRYQFQDRRWMKERRVAFNKPMNIYELHLGSWKRKSDEPDDWYSYREMAEQLIPYLKEAGYNYLELMPLGEYPSDESWGVSSHGLLCANIPL